MRGIKLAKQGKAVEFLRKINIFPRIFLVITFVSVFPILFLGLFSFQAYEAELRENTQVYLSILTQNLASQVDSSLESCEDLSRSFYAQSNNMNLLSENNKIAEEIEDFTANPLYIDNKQQIEERLFQLASAHGKVINISLVTPFDQYGIRPSNDSHGAILRNLDDFRQSEYYLGAIERGGYGGWYDTTETDDFLFKFDYSTQGIGNTFTLTTALYEQPEKEFLGVFMVNIDANLFRNNFSYYSFHDAGNTFLLTESVVLDYLNLDFTAPNPSTIDNLFQEIYGERSGSFTGVDMDGREVFAVHHQSEKLPIYVTHIVDMDNMLESAHEVREKSMTLVGGMLLICLILAHLTSRSISLPLRTLLKRMEIFTDDFSVLGIEVTGKDELTIVGRHFNEMANRTKELLEEIVTARTREKNLELSRVTAQLNALQMQINPHFMYNTLDIIRWSTIRIGGGENDASKMIDKFCKLMRMSVKKNENYVTAASELDHVEAYLAVVNLGNAKAIELETSIEFDTNFYYLPKLTLQPLVENSVVHGFRKGMKNPKIHIRGFALSDHIMITITDNGKGMAEEQLQELRSVFSNTMNFQESIGLRNVNQRFSLSFGEEYGVTVESVEEFGTEITIKLPKEVFPSKHEF